MGTLTQIVKLGVHHFRRKTQLLLTQRKPMHLTKTVQYASELVADTARKTHHTTEQDTARKEE